MTEGITRVHADAAGGEVRVVRRATLRVLEGPDRGAALELGDRSVTLIGTHPDADLVLSDDTVSRRHAELTLEDAGYVLRDLGSTNGITLSGVRMREAVIDPACPPPFYVGSSRLQLEFAAEEVTHALSPSERFGEALGRSSEMRRLFALLERVAPTDASVMLLGESGTGKEVLAEAIHRGSARADGPFVVFDCAAVSPALIESELFGHEAGAFTGANRARPGIFEEASGGTLFIDEIGELPLPLQPKLLRILAEGEVRRVGSSRPKQLDVRVVCATHRDLYQFVKEGKFRGDLLARLNEHVVRLPPLRERKEDIFLLANSFCARYGRPGMQFSFSFLVALFHYDWPFNVRELESCIKRGVALTDGGELDTMHLPDAISEHMKGYGDRQRVSLPGHVPAAPYGQSAIIHTPGGTPTAPPPRRGPPTEEELRGLLERHKGNVAAVGRELGKERMQVHRWLKRYNIDLSHYRAD